MTSDARSSARAMRKLATGFAAGAPALIVPELAFAATTDNVLLAASVSGITGAALGALVGGGIGYAAYRRNQRDLQRVIMRFAQTGEDRETSAVPEPTPEAKPQTQPQAVRETVRPAAKRTEVEPPRSELIDALPTDPLRIVEPMAKPGSQGPSHGRIDPRALPDPLAAPAPSSQVQASPRDAEVAPGHGFVAADATAGSVGYVPSASNPYLAGEPRSEAPAKVRAQAGEETPKPFDYADFAVDYVAKKSLRERMTITAKGVAAVLGERMGRSMMDGVPVIERADGSVGDVGTSWWERDARVQRSPEAARMSAPDLAAVSSMASYASRLDVQAPSAHGISGEERSRLIVSRVAPVEEEAYPEVGFQWQAQEDTWESALAALDERVEDNLMAGREERARRRAARRAAVAAQPQRLSVAVPPAEPRAFADAVGSLDTIDEPDGLERDTQFLNFRAPGNHPEVQDTGSYINYLIEDEFKRNPSSHARRQARSYLRVHEGGQNTRAQEAI